MEETYHRKLYHYKTENIHLYISSSNVEVTKLKSLIWAGDTEYMMNQDSFRENNQVTEFYTGR